jgi:phosphoribosylanthranilate isomerase
MIRIKICGIKTLAGALSAIEAGADLLGFNFYPRSVRYLTPGACGGIGRVLEKDFPHITRVGVFVNAAPAEILSILEQGRLHLAQLHGDETPAWLDELGVWAFKAVRLPAHSEAGGQEAALLFAQRRQGQSPSILVDASVPGAYGGTGAVTNWRAASELAKQVPLLLAGGLTPENVAAAVRQVRPWGVDTASGVETNPGEKDARKMKAFVQAARSTAAA